MLTIAHEYYIIARAKLLHLRQIKSQKNTANQKRY